MTLNENLRFSTCDSELGVENASRDVKSSKSPCWQRETLCGETSIFPGLSLEFDESERKLGHSGCAQAPRESVY